MFHDRLHLPKMVLLTLRGIVIIHDELTDFPRDTIL
jgi:hypothetical protein